jgi:hypothetical protein
VLEHRDHSAGFAHRHGHGAIERLGGEDRLALAAFRRIEREFRRLAEQHTSLGSEMGTGGQRRVGDHQRHGHDGGKGGDDGKGREHPMEQFRQEIGGIHGLAPGLYR